MSARGAKRGQPLVALTALLAGWIGGRAVNWEPPALLRPAAAGVVSPARAASEPPRYRLDAGAGPISAPEAWSGMLAGGQILPPGVRFVEVVPVAARYGAGGYAIVRDRRSTLAQQEGGSGYVASRVPAGAADIGLPPGRPDADELAFAQPATPFYAPALAPDPQASAAPAPAVPSRKRWSLDSWAFFRGNPQRRILPPGALAASYGASQSGAIMRYNLDPANPRRPVVYARTTTTLGGVRETSGALGLAARPVAAVPVTAAVEARLTQYLGRSRVQPVAMAVTELPPLHLTRRLRAEAYGQAGYVAGPYATPFADGQVRVDHDLLRVGSVESRLGAGAWAGAQTGASRVDVGPSASLTAPLSRGMFGRLAVDWRFRLSGNAQPDSGPALTVSAGF